MDKNIIPMKKSGFCAWPGDDDHGHKYCNRLSCVCSCHGKPEEAGDNAENQQ